PVPPLRTSPPAPAPASGSRGGSGSPPPPRPPLPGRDPAAARDGSRRAASRPLLRRALRAQDEVDGARVRLPGALLLLERATAARGQLVEARPAVVLGDPPFGLDEAPAAEPVERGVERPLLHPQELAGRAGDPATDRVSVPRPPLERLQDQHVERALHQLHGPSPDARDMLPSGRLPLRRHGKPETKVRPIPLRCQGERPQSALRARTGSTRAAR